MKQSRTASLTESLLNVGIGFGISLAAQMAFLPMLGVKIDHAQNFQFALIMTAVSIVRSYAVRRLFEALHIRQPMSAFLKAVLAERQRQIHAEGFDAEQDDEQRTGVLGGMGAAYLLNAGMPRVAPDWWDGGEDWWKPQSVRRDLVRGCALGLAEGERFDRVTRQCVRVAGAGVKAEWPKGTHP